ncbi:hypothetical protein [Streptomyces sp. NPDC001135]
MIPLVRVMRNLILGVTLSFSCVGCMGGSEGITHESSPDQFTPLSQLKSVDSNEERIISANEFPPKSRPPKVVGEVRESSYRLVAYIQGDSCGLRVGDAKNSTRSLIHVTSAWPKNNSEGTASYPAGPYSFASAAGASGSGLWVSLACSKSAMVIDYSSRDHASASGQRGNVSIAERRNDAGKIAVIIGSPEVRERILPQVQNRRGVLGLVSRN